MENKPRIVILGAGESGTGCAYLAQQKGFEVFLSDSGNIKENYIKELRNWEIPFEQGSHTEALILNASKVIKSPGIPEKAPIVQAIRKAGIPIVSEIDFAAAYTNAKLIGITGTNGKTTTTMLTYHLLKQAGFNVGLAGNIGQSFAKQVALYDFDYYVLEISSFQLDDTYNTHFDIAVITNITPDHLDRYQYNLDLYVAAKFRIGQNQLTTDVLIYNADDELTQNWINHYDLKAQLIPFSVFNTLAFGASLKDDQLLFALDNNPFTVPMNELSIKGKHNAGNAMAAGIVGRLLEIRKESIRESLSNFENVEHRLEFVATIRGVDFINDSKATNVNSAWYALESLTRPVVWIAGGIDKGNDYNVLKALVKDKVKAIVCLGKDNLRLHEAFSNEVEIMVNTQSMPEAVQMASHLAQKGDIVLLSPACASFDLFLNYEDRGRQFKKAVKML